MHTYSVPKNTLPEPRRLRGDPVGTVNVRFFFSNPEATEEEKWLSLAKSDKTRKIEGSAAHFCQSQVTDWLKSKADCSNPPQDLGSIKRQFWWSHVPLLYGAADKPALISKQNSSLGSEQKIDVLTSASGLQRKHVLAKVSGHALHRVTAYYASFL